MNRQPENGCSPKATDPPLSDDVAVLADAQLVAMVVEGSHDALAEVYERHGTEVYRLAERLRGLDAADDIVREVFLRLWQRPHSFDPARGSLRSFLVLQTHGRSADLIRTDTPRRTRETAVAVDEHSHHPAVDDAALALLAGEHAWSLLAGLTDGERSAIVLALFGGYTYRDIAVLLAQPEGTIKSRMRSGLSRLRDQMGTVNADSRPSDGETP